MPPRTKNSLLAAFLLLVSCKESIPAKVPETAKPDLYLITSLPIVWGESFALDQPKSPVMAALEKDYRVKLIDLPSQLPEGALLLAAQPRALPPEELVRLDDWVGNGGRMLLLADPMLEWPSDLPLGDVRRPPMGFADTGLLQHWGIRLDAPEQRGVVDVTLGGKSLLAASPGTLVGSGCKITDDGLRAECKVGKGKAVIVADADFLNAGSDTRASGNIAALESQLTWMTR